MESSAKWMTSSSLAKTKQSMMQAVLERITATGVTLNPDKGKHTQTNLLLSLAMFLNGGVLWE